MSRGTLVEGETTFRSMTCSGLSEAMVDVVDVEECVKLQGEVSAKLQVVESLKVKEEEE